MSEVIIEVKAIKKHFKEVKAVNGISLDIHKGEFLALLGPNGAGKTTLVEMIEGLQKPTEGEIHILGTTWEKDPEILQYAMGISLQETRFIDKLTVFETLKLFASFYNIAHARIIEVMELIRLSEKRKSFVVNLSGGQRQRLALGIAILNKPKILLLDEPTTGLDPNSRREIWDVLKSLKSAYDTTMILTTHYMEEAAFLCEKIVIIDHGEILAEGALNELLDTHKTNELIEFYLHGDDIHEAQFKNIRGLQNYKWNQQTGKGQILVNDIVTALPEVMQIFKKSQSELRSFECRKMTLDDLFVSMTGRRLND